MENEKLSTLPQVVIPEKPTTFQEIRRERERERERESIKVKKKKEKKADIERRKMRRER